MSTLGAKVFGFSKGQQRWLPVQVTDLGDGTGALATTPGTATARLATSFTRPADTTAYSSLDAVSNSTTSPAVLTFTGAARVAGGAGYITGARLRKSTSTPASFRLHLFHTAPAAIADNSPFLLRWDDRDKAAGTIDLSCGTEGTGSDAAEGRDFTVRIPYVCASTDTALYGLLEVLGAYTPGNAEQFYIELLVERN